MNCTPAHEDARANAAEAAVPAAESFSPDSTVEAKAKEIESLSLTALEDGGGEHDPPLLDDSDNSQIQAVTSAEYKAAATFEELNLPPELLKGLHHEMGFTRPSKIQAITLPMILMPPYKDLVLQAHYGSGKTVCSALGMVSRVDPRRKFPQAIWICPTRELAQQNNVVLTWIGKFTGITCACVTTPPGKAYGPISGMRMITDQVVIGTSGTLMEWITHKKLATWDIKILVFDEADNMVVEDNFRNDSERIMQNIKRSAGGCQVLLFSAIINESVKDFVPRVIKDGNQIFVKKEELALEKIIKQYKVQVPNEAAKIDVIRDKICRQKVGHIIVFVRTKQSTKNLHKALTRENYACSSVQGSLDLSEMEKVIQDINDGYTKILISTDVLARVFDQVQVNLVINYDLPFKFGTRDKPDNDLYLQRIGRAGRFGTKGAVFNLLCGETDNVVMKTIEDNFNHKVSEVSDWKSEEDFEIALKDVGLLE